MLYYRRNAKKTLTKNMLAYLAIHNNYFTAASTSVKIRLLGKYEHPTFNVS